MLDNAIVHISRSALPQSSRIQYQLSRDDGEHIGGTKFLDYSTVKLILSNPRVRMVIFHEHNSLGNLTLALLLRRLHKTKVRFVLDIHDLLELHTDLITIKSLTFYLVAAVLQRVALHSDVDLMTVSPDISNLLEDKYSVKVETILSTAPQIKSKAVPQSADQKSIVYFGSINAERLNKKHLEPLFEAGFSLDVFGYFSNGFTEHDLKMLAPVPDQVRYLGKYNGQGITEIISSYRASWMAYESRYKNFHFCLPNKLFQSLSVGTPCIVHNSMVSSRRLTKAGFKIYTVEDFLSLECAERSSMELYNQYEQQNSKRYIEFLTSYSE